MYSDKICTALQLTNFYQDVSADFKRGRIYFPQDEMEHFGTDEWTFEINEINDKLKSLVQFSIERTEDLFNEGKKLLPFLKGRIRIEIEWTIRGGMKILRKISKNDYDVFKRPVLNFSDFTGILIKSFF